MPKVSKKEAQRPLVEAAPMGLDQPEAADLPSTSEPALAKPHFPPLNAFEQSGKKLEFRRVTFCLQAFASGEGIATAN